MRIYITPEEYDIAEKNGIKRNTLDARVHYYMWDKKKAITWPVDGDPEYKYWLKVAKSKGVKHSLFSYRVRTKKMSFEDAAMTPVRKRRQPIRKG